MPRVRDAQKGKVYIWEQHMVWDYDGNAQDVRRPVLHSAPNPMTIDQSKELVERAVRWWWRTWLQNRVQMGQAVPSELHNCPSIPTVRDGGRRRSKAYYRPLGHMISLPEWARYPEVILHECAHCILNQHGYLGSCDGGHGAYFLRIYIQLLKKFMGMNSKLLTRSARASGIEVKSLAEIGRPARLWLDQGFRSTT